MMDRIQAGRKKTMGKRKQFAKDSKADRHLPA
jgi:ribosomal protein L39E